MASLWRWRHGHLYFFFSKWWTSTLTTPNRIFQYTLFFKTLNVNHQSWGFCVLSATQVCSLPYISVASSKWKWPASILYIIAQSASSWPHHLFSALTFLTWNFNHLVSSSLQCYQDKILGSIAWCTGLLVNWALLPSHSPLAPLFSHLLLIL